MWHFEHFSWVVSEKVLKFINIFGLVSISYNYKFVYFVNKSVILHMGYMTVWTPGMCVLYNRDFNVSFYDQR